MTNDHAPLLEQDRGEFEQVLRQALASTPFQEALRRADGDVEVEQLHACAMQASGQINAAATAEYRTYLQLRAAARTDAPGEQIADVVHVKGGRWQLGAALAVLVPILGGIAAALFLLLGYGLRLTGATPDLADTLVTTGWIAAGVAALVMLMGIIVLLAKAAGNRSTQSRAPGSDAVVEQARDAWQRALLERGVLPFLDSRLRQEQAPDHAATAPHPTFSESANRTDIRSKPHIG